MLLCCLLWLKNQFHISDSSSDSVIGDEVLRVFSQIRHRKYVFRKLKSVTAGGSYPEVRYNAAIQLLWFQFCYFQLITLTWRLDQVFFFKNCPIMSIRSRSVTSFIPNRVMKSHCHKFDNVTFLSLNNPSILIRVLTMVGPEKNLFLS